MCKGLEILGASNYQEIVAIVIADASLNIVYLTHISPLLLNSLNSITQGYALKRDFGVNFLLASFKEGNVPMMCGGKKLYSVETHKKVLSKWQL